jgi:acetyl-CoA carboxylase beta subunit
MKNMKKGTPWKMVRKKCPSCNSSKFKREIGTNKYSCKKCDYVLDIDYLKTTPNVISPIL